MFSAVTVTRNRVERFMDAPWRLAQCFVPMTNCTTIATSLKKNHCRFTRSSHCPVSVADRALYECQLQKETPEDPTSAANRVRGATSFSGAMPHCLTRISRWKKRGECRKWQKKEFSSRSPLMPCRVISDGSGSLQNKSIVKTKNSVKRAT